MRIGELARELGVSADTVRFYEREGLLPGPRRAENGYRQYAAADLERLRLLLELRRLDLPLADAARLAGWCQSGHCNETSTELPRLLDERREDVQRRITALRELDARLASLARHLELTGLPMLGGAACCTAAAAVDSAFEAEASGG